MSKPLSLLVSILLLLPILSLPSAQSQAYTTITTQTTSLLTSYQTSLISFNSMGQFDIFQSYQDNVVILEGSTYGHYYLGTDIRNIIVATSGVESVTSCYAVAADFYASEGQRLVGSIGSTNVPVGLFVTDNASFYGQALANLQIPSIRGCTSDVLFHNLTPIVNDEAPPYPSYARASYSGYNVSYALTIPHSGVWWITGWVNGIAAYSILFGPPPTQIKWSWNAFLYPITYVTTWCVCFTVTNAIKLSETENSLLTQQLPQTFPFSAEQLYAGLAAVFGVLLVVTLGLLVKQRQGRTKRRR